MGQGAGIDKLQFTTKGYTIGDPGCTDTRLMGLVGNKMGRRLAFNRRVSGNYDLGDIPPPQAFRENVQTDIFRADAVQW